MGDNEVYKVLVAEDSTPNRNILSHLLNKLGFEVIEAKNGKEAKDLLKYHTDVKIIISDIMMPEENGIDVLEFARGHDTLKDVPFLLVTAVSEKEYIIKAKEFNVTGYILKPISFDKLTSKLKEVFPNKEFKLAS